MDLTLTVRLTVIYLFDFFNNAVSNSDYIESNGRTISESEGMKKAVVE